jgi:hypothetical protein
MKRNEREVEKPERDVEWIGNDEAVNKSKYKK